MPEQVFVPQDFPTIQAGVNAVDPFGTVVVAPGTYNEIVNVNKTVQLHGAGYNKDARKRVLMPQPESVVNGGFVVFSEKVVIDGFTVQNNSTGPGITLLPFSSGHWIFNNIIQNNVFGIYANTNGVLYSQIAQNVIRNNRQPGAASGNGIYTDQGSTNIIIRDNFLTGHDPVNAAGINFAFPFVGTNQNIYITDNLLFQDSSIALTATTNAKVARNCLIQNAASAIFFGGGTTLTDIEGNFILGNNTAINVTNFFTGTENTEIRAKTNNIEGNTTGLNVVNGGYTGILDATNNWWGSPTGPSGIGPGTGDPIINNDPNTTILFIPFLTAEPARIPCEASPFIT